MSHQDAYVKEDRLNADCLNEAFLWLFKGIDWSAIQFHIDCGWMPATFAAMALLFAWSSEQTLIDRFRSSLKIIAFLFPEERRSKPKAKKGQSKKRKESKHKLLNGLTEQTGQAGFINQGLSPPSPPS